MKGQPTPQKVKRRIIDLSNQGHSLRQIARETGVCPSSCGKIIARHRSQVENNRSRIENNRVPANPVGQGAYRGLLGFHEG